MLSRRAAAVGVLSLIVTCVTAVPASAQDYDVRRPYRGIFGSPPSSESGQSLVATASIYAAYDDNVYQGLTDTRNLGSPWFQQSGTYQGANAGLNYSFDKEGERFDFGVQTGAQVNYFRTGNESDVLPAYQGSADFDARLTRSLTFNVRQNLAYSSFYASSLGPEVNDDLGSELGVADDINFGLFRQKALYSATRANLSQTLGRYSTLGVSYHLRTRRSLATEVENAPLREYTSQAVAAGFRYARPMTRYATLRAGYGIRWTDRERFPGEPEVMHNIDTGVDYSRALSFSRRTFFSFGTGSAITVSDEVPAVDDQRRVRAWLLGNAALVHEMGRTWTAGLRYSRGFRTLEGFDHLYFTDAMTASVGGLVTRRLQLSAAAIWSESSLESNAARHHSNQSAVAQATYGITSFLAAYASYVYVKYRFDQEMLIDEPFPRQLDRHGVRVGLTTSVPLIR